MSSISPEMESLKGRLKATWMSGDFDKIAEIIWAGGAEFIARLQLTPGTRLLDVACGTGNLSFPAARAGAIVFAALDEAEQAALRRDLQQLWTGQIWKHGSRRWKNWSSN